MIELPDSLKVYHLFDHSIPLQSGYSMRSVQILRGQRRLGWITRQLTGPKQCLSRRRSTMETIDGLDFVRAAAPRNWVQSAPMLDQAAVVWWAKKELAAMVNEDRPSIIHAHSPCLNGIAGLVVGRQYNVPVVYEMRATWEDAAVNLGTTFEDSSRYRLTRWMEERVLAASDQVVTICEGLREDIIQRGIDGRNVSVVPNGVDIKRFPVLSVRDPELESKLGLSGCYVIGFVGSLYDYEGLQMLVTSISRIKAKVANVRILIVGGGPVEAHLKKTVRESGMARDFVFVSRVHSDEVARYYSLIDLALYPRLPMRLTEIVTPLKPLEAMALGKLVLASNVGGHCELVSNGQTGFLFRAGDIDALAEAVVDIVAKPEKAEAVRREARRWVERHRSWEHVISLYSDIYKAALRG